MKNVTATTKIENRNSRDFTPRREPQWVARRYRHILVPTSLDDADRSALMLGIEMAALHRASLSVLHVLPYDDYVNSINWLDAIDCLHRALDQRAKCAPSNGSLDAEERARLQVE